MADFEEILDFPPAPKLDLFGKLDPAKATPAEMHGQDLFFGKGQCASCHQPPYYTDNLMHDLKTERFFKPEMVNYAMMFGDGKNKTFALRGVKDNPPLTASRPPPRSAPAAYWQSVANYRQTVLTAFQQAARRRPGHEPVADANRAGERFSLLPRQAQAARAEAHCIVVTGAAGPAPGRGEAITPSRVAQ